MDVSGALSAYTYQSTLAQTGSTSQALTKALAANQSQAAQTGALLASAGSLDATSNPAGGAVGQALASLAYSASAASGNGPEAVQAMLATLGGSTSGLLPTADHLPVLAAALTPGATQALARYAYDQSQDPKAVEQAALQAGQQTLQSTGLDLLA